MRLLPIIFLALMAPPKREFHQGVDYRIEARLDDATNVLTGRARMRYTNRAPSSLDTLYFHLHLNAFRPNSAWAQRELQFNSRRFQDLGPDDYAYDRVSSIRVNGKRVQPFYPHAPDSTVMGIALPARIAPKASAVVDMDWTSRTATVARRQGRKGRHYDFAHWYPRIAVYDTTGWETQTLLPQGEFFGEFASYDISLDLAADQVMAATGVPVTGDPGWDRVNQNKTAAPFLNRSVYRPRALVPLGLLKAPPAGRKQIRWRAEQVHHFAWTTDPDFLYEGDRVANVGLHVLYTAPDTLWPKKAIATLKSSLLFYDSVMGPYVYPQLTATRRVDGGGTEFPMIQMNGTNPPIVHETGHMWAHAILANNEFKEGWLDEGFDSFLNMMYSEAEGRTPNLQRALDAVAKADAAGTTQPISTAAADFKDFNLYQTMTYTKPQLVLNMLRFYIGDAAMRRGLRLYYSTNKLTHVDENDLRVALEKASGQDLRTFFHEWLHTTGTVDYAITSAVSTQQANGEWQTVVEVARNGANWMPVTLKVGDRTIRIETHDHQFRVVATGAAKPAEAVLDPEGILLDPDRANNRKTIE